MCRRSKRSQRSIRLGMSLVELLAVATILLMMAGTLGSLSLAVHNTHEFQATRGLALQHGQTVVQRIQRHLEEATCNASFPGMAVFSETIGGDRFPETLVVWHPLGPATDPAGLPRINELVVYCPNPAARNELWEITKPLDVRPAPALSNLAEWQVELNSFRSDRSAVRNVITDLLRVATLDTASTTSTTSRSTLRFDLAQRPSADDWQNFLAGRTTWDDLPWVQGIRGSNTGLCQTRCHIEFQLRPADSSDSSRDSAIPFFGSGAVYFQRTRP